MKAQAMEIMQRFANNSGYSVEELTGKRRTINLCDVRHRAMAEVREQTGLSYPEIGMLFNRDHSSVFHGIQKVRGELIDQTTRQA